MDKADKMLEWTKERYLPYIDPRLIGAEIHYEHLHRYAFAARFAKDKTVLDLASGEGYGSFMLSKDAKEVFGIEIDRSAVEHAIARYRKDNLKFIHGSILDIPLDGKKLFDLVVCFEAMEHVQDHNKLLSEIKRLLSDEGILIISTPNKITYTDEPKYNNPFHINELYYDDFKNILCNYFSDVLTFGQRVYVGSHIWRIGSDARTRSKEILIKINDLGFIFSDDLQKSPLYFIALAANMKFNNKFNINSYLTDVSNTALIQKDNELSRNADNAINEVKELATQDVQLKECIISDLQSQLQEANNRADLAEREIADMDKAINEVKELATQDVQLKECIISDLQSQLQEANNRADLAERDIKDMQRSIIWRSVNRFHNVFIEKTCPQSTKRREFYDLFLKGSRIIVNDGWANFWLQFRGYRSAKKEPYKEIYFSPVSNLLDLSMPEEVNKLEVKASIVIPTKNAGPDFVYTMEKIRCQRGVSEIEVIIVDSGSSDDTVYIAKKYGATTYEIDPEEFGHGKTRNYAASKATGDYIIFTVQDAIPIGDHWLYNLVRVLCDRDDIAAVTCRQVPRSDADLFARISIWNHHRYLEPNGDALFGIKEEALEEISAAELRKAAGLNNVCNCIDKRVFDEFKFKEIFYAEDLDLGVRLLKEGHKICFLASTGVIHSHNRDINYYLRRSYVDAKSLAIILNEAPSAQYKDLDVVICELLSLYDSLKCSTNFLNLKHETRAELIFSEVKSNLFREDKCESSIEYTNTELDKILNDFRKLVKFYSPNRRTIYDEYIDLLDSYTEYFEVTGQSCDNLESFDIIFRLFAVYCGISFGRSSYYNLDDERINYINKILSTGI